MKKNNNTAGTESEKEKIKTEDFNSMCKNKFKSSLEFKEISLKKKESQDFVNLPNEKKSKANIGNNDHIKQVRNMLKFEAIRK